MSQPATVRLVGLLFLIQLITAAVSYSVLLEPILYGGNFLEDMQAKATTVRVALFLDLICGAAIVAIAVLLFPILKMFSERIAMWYVGLRCVEFATIIVSGILLLTLLSISHDTSTTGISDATKLEGIGRVVLQARGWTQNMTIIVYGLGAIMFYFLLYRSRLLPRFISIWGLGAVVLLLTEIILDTFGHGYGMPLMMPMGLNELFLGGWLLVKGFRSTDLKPKPELNI